MSRTQDFVDRNRDAIIAGKVDPPARWVVAQCEVCARQWVVQQSLRTRTCSRQCGLKINPATCRDESTWTTVECCECGTQIKRRKIYVRDRSFCSRTCLSSGFAKLHQSHDTKRARAHGIRRGTYLTRDGRSIKYDSSYELRRMQEYDYLMDDSLLAWERCKLAIPYRDPDGRLRHYNPDFQLSMLDGRTIIEEVKGVIDDGAVLKHDALIDFCRRNGGDLQARLFSRPDFSDRLEVKTKTYVNDYGVFSRPTLEYVFMSMARTLAERSTCIRKKVGVVFTDPLMQQAYCLGYNGDEIGGKNQCESLKPGMCNCVHAEINALTKNNFDITNCTCFITLAPCPVCAKVLINRRVRRVVYLESYRNSRGIQLLIERGIDVVKYERLVDSASDIL